MPGTSEPKDVGELWRLISLQLTTLQSQLSAFNARMDGMVDRRIFDAAQARNTERFAEVEKDIAESRADARSSIAASRASEEKAMAEIKTANEKSNADMARALEKISDRISQSMRIAFTSLIAPIIVAVVVAFILTRST